MRKAKRKPLSGCVGQLHFSFFSIDRRMCPFQSTMKPIFQN